MADPKHGCAPLRVEETPGKKAYCTCGWSEKLPYCDGAHNRMETGCAPIVLEVEQADTKWICQCHKSAKMPFCDGTHKNIPAPDA